MPERPRTCVGEPRETQNGPKFSSQTAIDDLVTKALAEGGVEADAIFANLAKFRIGPLVVSSGWTLPWGPGTAADHCRSSTGTFSSRICRFLVIFTDSARWRRFRATFGRAPGGSGRCERPHGPRGSDGPPSSHEARRRADSQPYGAGARGFVLGWGAWEGATAGSRARRRSFWRPKCSGS